MGRKLSWCTTICYCHFYLVVNAFYAVYPLVRGYVYRDTLKLSLGATSWLLASVKCLDLVSGAVIGRFSDTTRSRWGRRKPFIAAFWPCAMVVLVLMSAGGFFFRAHNPTKPCGGLVNTSGSSSGECPALEACLDANISSGSLLPFDAPDVASLQLSGSNEAAISAYFFVVFFLYFLTFISGSVLVYDALGQELTDDYDVRGGLFALKGFFAMLGACIGSLLIGQVYAAFPTDSVMASFVTTLVLALYGLVAWALLLWGVREGAAVDDARTAPVAPTVPFAVSFMRMIRNPPYRYYLLMKVPMTFLGQLPYQLLLLFYQNNMRLESTPDHLYITQLCAILGAFVSIPCQLWLSRRFGRKATMTWLLLGLSLIFLAATFIPIGQDGLRWLIFPLGVFLGVCLTLPNTIPDPILGDIIDYDEMLSGFRSEALYTMVETNIQQGIELLLTAAQLFIGLAGWEPLGGCACGCGVACPVLGMPHARWVCPGSVGYACDDALGAALLFEGEPNVAPCAVQNDAVYWVTAIFFCLVPGLSGLAAIPAARRAVISKQQQAAIREGVAALRADPRAAVTDPITQQPLVRVSNAPDSLLEDHFTRFEWQTVARAGATAGMRKLASYLTTRLGVACALFGGLLVANIALAASGDKRASETLLQVSFILLAVLLVLVPLDLLRLRAVRAGAAGLAHVDSAIGVKLVSTDGVGVPVNPTTTSRVVSEGV